MQARATTDIDGGSVEVVYTTDPKYIDGLTQRELIETVVTLIPALLYATTYTSVDMGTVAEALRDYADMWDPQTQDGDDYTYWEGQH